MMLVLTRKRNEAIVLDDQTTITVLKSNAGHVVLGIVAPKAVIVKRAEIICPIVKEVGGEEY